LFQELSVLDEPLMKWFTNAAFVYQRLSAEFFRYCMLPLIATVAGSNAMSATVKDNSTKITARNGNVNNQINP
jgi:hypothetical protein